MPDLWPEDIQVVNIEAPVTILREQANLLGQKTKNFLKAEVNQIQPSRYKLKNKFYYEFLIVAPALENYHYSLFSISHEINLYPVAFSLDFDMKEEFGIDEETDLLTNFHDEYDDVIANSPDEFVEILRRILRSKKTTAVIQALLAQSADYDPMEAEIPF